MTGRVFRHRAPAGANFQQMIARVQRQLVTQARHFGPLSRREILLVSRKQRAGIEQLFIQKMGIKCIAQIVMGGNIFARLRAGVTPRPVTYPLQRPAEQTEAVFQTTKHLAVEREQLQKRRQVRGFPFAIHPGLCRSKAPAR